MKMTKEEALEIVWRCLPSAENASEPLLEAWQILKSTILAQQNLNETIVYKLLKRYCGYGIDGDDKGDLCACDKNGSFDTTDIIKCTKENCYPLAEYNRALKEAQQKTNG
jgi:hypothetical protein